MKVSSQWLKEWVDFDLEPSELSHIFTMGGLEVDEVHVLGQGLDGVVVAEILAADPHPDADRLRVCEVAGDSEPRTIVCGAPNAQPGLKAPLATLGSTLPNGLTIKAAKLRGVASSGMLCSATELGLGEGPEASAGLMALPPDAPVGQPLGDYLQLNDTVLDIDLTPNRADCLSVRGLALELAALTGSSYRPLEVETVDAVVDERVEIELSASEDCAQYCARVIVGVNAKAPTPLWVKERLRRCGVRPISLVVDVTNYVLLELGQPMHAFDRSKIHGAVVVRRAATGESLELLDGQTVELDESCLVIADQDTPLALAGIMGGEGSAVHEETTSIVLESAWFSPASLAGQARRFGLHTESSHRFERGVDPELQVLALERATGLICQLAGGQAGPICQVKEESHLPKSAPITLQSFAVNRLLGTDLDAAVIGELLRRLNMQVETVESETLSVIAPSARVDIQEPADLIEEVARLVGYDQLPSHPPAGELRLLAPRENHLSAGDWRGYWVGRGFQEVMGWSFIPEGLTNPNGELWSGLTLANPLSRDMALMRPSLVAGLVEIAANNARRGQFDLRLFELGHCFSENDEWPAMGLLMAGQREGEHFKTERHRLDYYDIKGAVEHLIKTHQLGDFSFEPNPGHPWLHPAQSAAVSREGRVVGWLGQLHPSVAEQFDLRKEVFVAELNLAKLGDRLLPEHHTIAKYPSSRRDIAVVVPESIHGADLLSVIREAGGVSLEKCVLFDVYQGSGVEKGFKSVAMGLIIRDNSRTLTDQDVETVVTDIVNALESAFKATLRG